jgi:hypothetical protein
MPLMEHRDPDFVEPPNTLFDLASIVFSPEEPSESPNCDVDMPSPSPTCSEEPTSLEDLPGLRDNIVILETFHPRRKRAAITTSLDQLLSEPVLLEPEENDMQNDPSWYRPWAPFRTRADFEIAEQFTVQNMSDNHIDTFLRALGPESGREHNNEDHSSTYQQPYLWHVGQSFITMRSKKAYHECMEKARAHLVKVNMYASSCCHRISD